MFQNHYLTAHNKALYKVLNQFLTTSLKPSRLKLIGMDNVMNDFDDLNYCIVTNKSISSNPKTHGGESTTILEMHVRVSGDYWSSIKSYALEDLCNTFGTNKLVALIKGEDNRIRKGYNFAFLLNCNTAAIASDDERNTLILALSNLRSLVLGTRLRRILKASIRSDKMLREQTSFILPFRHNLGACLVIQQEDDRINVVFDVHYADVNERAIARTYMKQFSGACRFCEYHKWNNLPGEVLRLNKSQKTNIPSIECSEISAGFLVMTFRSFTDDNNKKIEQVVNFVVMFLNNLLHDVTATKTDLYARVRHNGNLLLEKFSYPAI